MDRNADWRRLWAQSQLWPLWNHADPHFLADANEHEAVSEDGTLYVLRKDHDGERCNERHPAMAAFCFSMKGHDGPHMPMSVELAERIGPLLVVSMTRQAGGGAAGGPDSGDVSTGGRPAD